MQIVKDNSWIRWMGLCFLFAVPAFAEDLPSPVLGETAAQLESGMNYEMDPGVVDESEEVVDEDGPPIALYYYGIFFGPSIKSPKAYQPSPAGGYNRDYPLIMRNYLGLSYGLAQDVVITPTAFWTWRPVMGQQLTLQDPFVRLSWGNIIDTEHFNLYADIRTHLGVSSASRKNDLRVGLQNFQALSFVPDPDLNLVLSVYGSIRYNFFGKHGNGNDLELYLAPHLSYRFLPNLAFTLLYEMQAVHPFGASVGSLENDGTDLEPGIQWDISPTLTINPYINLYPGNKLNLQTSSIGMTVTWNIL
jgi:hypothetical protein